VNILDAGTQVRGARRFQQLQYSSLIPRLGLLTEGVPDLLLDRPLITCGIVGNIDHCFSKRGHPKLREQGHIVLGEVLIKHCLLPSARSVYP